MFSESNPGVRIGRAPADGGLSMADALVAGAGPDPTDALGAARLATAQALLALYWEVQHQRALAARDPAGRADRANDASLEWLSALLCSGSPT
jgi:hypothetical protein